ncbi:MAG: trypsin-like peptidase domain-containing protein [Methylophilus sp.]|nr:trypsin-like peptidase domain-containing protein [Methylophilus sp.]
MIRLILLATTLLSTSLPAFSYDKERLMDAFFSVVMIRGYNASGGVAYGSGVVVGENKVITNCHVFRATKQPWISRGEDIYPITSVKADVWHDLCLVNTASMPFKPAKIGSSNTLKREQEVVGFGHSNGSPAPLTSNGVIKGLYDDNLGKVMRTTAKFAMGASGSGLFDMEGNLIGINTFKTAGKRGSIMFALPIEWLDSLDKQTNISTFPITGKALWEEDEDKKPYYMQAAVPESREDWPSLALVAEKWTIAEPKSVEAWYALGLALENMDKLALAEKAYRQATLLDDSHFDALVHLGFIAKTKGDSAEMHRIQIALANIDQALASEYSELLGCGKSC